MSEDRLQTSSRGWNDSAVAAGLRVLAGRAAADAGQRRPSKRAGKNLREPAADASAQSRTTTVL